MEGCKTEIKNSVYYGVHIPSDVQLQEGEDGVAVFEDKVEALKLVKKYKKARFKAFNYYHEAEAFAVHGCEYSTIDGANKSETGSPLVGEKPSQFRAPKWQDLIKLRKAIEAGDLQFVYSTIWDNPRYLVSLGDTPSILQEGCRYNALHVAARSHNAKMCELILSTISDLRFIKLLYGDDSPENIEERRNILLDLYLNTPGKGWNETPLHYAVRDCALECVEVLTSYPQCDRNCRNKYGETPSMIVGERLYLSEEHKNKFLTLLKDNFYVPVLRAENNCSEPVIGEPFSPTSPPNLNTNALKPRLEIHAYAGPMEKHEAEEFRKIWKKPLRNLKDDNVVRKRIKDMDKGLERVGKYLANKCSIEWREYWPFLDSFADISTDEGLELFEKYLAYRTNVEYSDSFLISSESPKEVSCSTSSSNLSDLCRAFQAFNLNDNTDSSSPVLNPFLYVERSCQVFANRISQPVLNLLENAQNSITQNLKSEIKHLEQSMTSYMEDVRFISVNFSVVHSRLGILINNRLKDLIQVEDDYISLKRKIEILLEKCNKHLDYFSSDDESMNHKNQVFTKKKSTSTNKQVVCLLRSILDGFCCTDLERNELNTEGECVAAWRQAKSCECVWKNNKKGSSLSRNNSIRQSRRLKNKEAMRKLIFDDSRGKNESFCQSNKESSSSDDEEFFTPPASPSMMQVSDCDDDSDEFFDDSQLPEKEIFIEGDQPTKADSAVFDALEFSECKLNPEKYPNVYKWFHSLSQYKPNERKNWGSPSVTQEISVGVTSTPIQGKSQQKFSSSFYTPPRSWLRITGVNSPKAALKEQHNNSANL